MIFDRHGPIRRSFRSPPVLETERLYLRRILPMDVEDMFEYSRNPETSRYLLWEPHGSIEFTRAHIRYLQEQYRKDAFFDWALIWKETGKMIGTCGFTEIYERKKSAEVGYVISPLFHRRGIAPEALERVVEYGFFTLGLTTLTARFMSDNRASGKVLTRLGFRDDTKKKITIEKRGTTQKIYTYLLCRENYEKRKKQEIL